MCGIVAVISANRSGNRSTRCATGSPTAGPTARSSWMTTTPRARRRPWPPAALDHRPDARRRPADVRRVGRSRTRLQRRDLQLRRAPRGARARRRILRDAERHRGAARRVRAVGNGLPRRASTACSRSLSGTAAATSSSSPATASARSRSSTPGYRRRLAFASEMKALFAHPAVRPRPNESVVPRLRRGNFYEDGEETIFDGVPRLPPAHAMVVGDDGSIRRRWRYWTPDYTPIDDGLRRSGRRSSASAACSSRASGCGSARTSRSGRASPAASTRRRIVCLLAAAADADADADPEHVLRPLRRR